jgi:hypothetical protein
VTFTIEDASKMDRLAIRLDQYSNSLQQVLRAARQAGMVLDAAIVAKIEGVLQKTEKTSRLFRSLSALVGKPSNNQSAPG